jgi:acetate kinase
MSSCILTLNAGSSSIRFALHREGQPSLLTLSGMVERIGLAGTSLSFRKPETGASGNLPLPAGGHSSAIRFLLDWLESQEEFAPVIAVGHRVVQGMNHPGPVWVTPVLLQELRKVSAYDPDHMPQEIELIEAILNRLPDIPQLACFDTSFHHTLPRVAAMLPLPRRFEATGLKRYGFHGLSYAFLLEELKRLDPAAAMGRVILAHLGNGAGLCAVKAGQSVDTTMGFTPAGGLMMGTRSGDLDPGVISYLMETHGMTASQFHRMVNQESGLLGVSESSSDVRDLLAVEATDVRAAEALTLFCYQATKWIGAFAAALGGVNTLVFAGGIGENSPVIRERICANLTFLGITLDPSRNALHAPIISQEESPVTVRIIPTDESLMIARAVEAMMAQGPTGNSGSIGS